MNVFGVVSRHAAWLQDRQLLLAQNIANSDTPGFRARDLEPFKLSQPSTFSNLVTTHKLHIADGLSLGSRPGHAVVETDNPDIAHSGNTVSLERETKKVGETSSAFSFDLAVAKMFHRLTLSSLKG
jgi:flagellar basal-body rod protein FlgB